MTQAPDTQNEDDELEDDEEWFFEDEENDRKFPDPDDMEIAEPDEPLRVDPQTVLNIKSVVHASGTIRLRKFGCKRSLMRLQAAARMAEAPHNILVRDKNNETATYYSYIAGPNFNKVTKVAT